MAPTSLLLLLLSLFFFFITTTRTNVAAIVHHKHKLSILEADLPSSSSSAPTPTKYFEVTRPIPKPSKPPCSTLLLRHDFGYTYSKPPITAFYTPPSHCSSVFGRRPSLAVLRWSAYSIGRQFDRIFGIWFNGVELLRSCTAEPRATGTFWYVEKDITRYSSLLSSNGTLAVYLGNLIDKTYTGVYHVNVTLDLYFSTSLRRIRRSNDGLVPGFGSPADLILPVSRNLPLNDGLWFCIKNSTDIQSKQVSIPSNTYRAVLEVFVSYHSDDEFWYTDPPNEYITSNNVSGIPGNGAFREVTARLDGEVIGAVWPFTVIYTGGVNPLLWRPITAIGSFDLPSYDIEVTPFIAKMLDGKPHEFGFGVTNALDVWYVDANLHLWLDHKSSFISGELIKHEAPEYQIDTRSSFKGLDGQFLTIASRKITSAGWVKSSYGKISTHFFQTFDYRNWMELSGNGTIQVINQTIDSNSGIYTKQSSSTLYSEQVYHNFPLYLYTATLDLGNNSYKSLSNISFAFNEKKFSGEKFGFSFSSLENLQTGQSVMDVKGNLVTDGVGKTQQAYRYWSTDGCYFRNVSSSNYTIVYDQSGVSCSKDPLLSNRYFPKRRYTSPVRRSSLDYLKNSHH